MTKHHKGSPKGSQDPVKIEKKQGQDPGVRSQKRSLAQYAAGLDSEVDASDSEAEGGDIEFRGNEWSKQAIKIAEHTKAYAEEIDNRLQKASNARVQAYDALAPEEVLAKKNSDEY